MLEHPAVLVPSIASPEKIWVALLNFVKAVPLPFWSQLQIYISLFHCRMAGAVRQGLRCPSIRRYFLTLSLPHAVFCLLQRSQVLLPMKSWVRGLSSSKTFLKSFCGELEKACIPQRRKEPQKEKKKRGRCKRRVIP